MGRSQKKTPPTNTSPDPVEQYARDVLAGEIVAGKWVRLACERHLRDLVEGSARGLRWDADEALWAIGFFPDVLKLAEGQHAGHPFRLTAWQQFIVGSLFGWKGEDGFRRFRTAYIEVGKGNGKSPLAAGIGLKCLVADGEIGAEVYSAATTRDQARIVFGDACKMRDVSPKLRQRLTPYVTALADQKTHSYFKPLSADASKLDGFRVHCALLDEVHEHPSSLVVDKLRAGTKGRSQALIVEITNAGYDRHSICYQHHDYSIKILEQNVENDSWFGFIAALDEGDDWRDESVWLKANPNLGVSISWKYLREQVAEAIGMPGKENIVRRLNFTEWTEQSVRWLPMEAWDECAGEVDLDRLRGRRCYGGLDLSTTTDLSALSLVFPSSDGTFDVLLWLWCPEEGIKRRGDRDRVPYAEWVRAGLMEATPGNVVDYGVIKTRILELARTYDIREIAYDRWNSHAVVTELTDDGAVMVPFGQGFASMSAPSKELEKLVTGRMIRHGGNPALRWMASNVSARTDPAGNIKPDKEKSGERIDGVVAMIMALGRAIVAPDPTSVYEERGLITI